MNLTYDSLFSLSATKRKFFLCRNTWKNKILVDLFASKARIKSSTHLGMQQINAAFKNKPSKKVLSQAQDQGTKILAEVIKGMNGPGMNGIEDNEEPVTVKSAIQVPALLSQSALLIDNFLKPTSRSISSHGHSGNNLQDVHIRMVEKEEQVVRCAPELSNRSCEPKLSLRILKLVEDCCAQHETTLVKWKQEQKV